MAEVSAHLCDRVIPQEPVRQWVLSEPKRLRPHLARLGARRRRRPVLARPLNADL